MFAEAIVRAGGVVKSKDLLGSEGGDRIYQEQLLEVRKVIPSIARDLEGKEIEIPVFDASNDQLAAWHGYGCCASGFGYNHDVYTRGSAVMNLMYDLGRRADKAKVDHFVLTQRELDTYLAQRPLIAKLMSACGGAADTDHVLIAFRPGKTDPLFQSVRDFYGFAQSNCSMEDSLKTLLPKIMGTSLNVSKVTCDRNKPGSSPQWLCE